MNKKQTEIITKKFKVNDKFDITRGDYEGLPCAMIAWEWSDGKMELLAKRIGAELKNYSTFEDAESEEDAFWVEMENVACQMGMGYYEDLTDKEFAANNKRWNSIN